LWLLVVVVSLVHVNGFPPKINQPKKYGSGIATKLFVKKLQNGEFDVGAASVKLPWERLEERNNRAVLDLSSKRGDMSPGDAAQPTTTSIHNDTAPWEKGQFWKATRVGLEERGLSTEQCVTCLQTCPQLLRLDPGVVLETADYVLETADYVIQEFGVDYLADEPRFLLYRVDQVQYGLEFMGTVMMANMDVNENEEMIDDGTVASEDDDGATLSTESTRDSSSNNDPEDDDIGYDDAKRNAKPSRRFVFVVNNYTPEHIRLLNIFGNPETDICSYLVYGKEIGEKDNTPHLQGFCITKKPMRFAGIHKKIGFTHIALRVAKASSLHAANYCKKGTMSKAEAKKHRDDPKFIGTDADVTEFGVCPMPGKRKRTDLDIVTEKLKDGATLEQASPALLLAGIDGGIQEQAVRTALEALSKANSEAMRVTRSLRTILEEHTAPEPDTFTDP